MLASAVSGIAQTVNSDMWAVTDALGRKVTDNVDSFPKRQGKQVAIFYWTWHERETKPTDKIKNITQILRDYPDALTDYNHPAVCCADTGQLRWITILIQAGFSLHLYVVLGLRV